MNFSKEERGMISDGLNVLIGNACSAKVLVHDQEVIEAVDKYLARLQELNRRICMESEK